MAEYRTGGMEVLRITLASGEEVFPVFSFEDEAKMFLKLQTSCGGWRVRVTTVGELVSVLFGPCAGVGRVVLDPLPDLFAEALMDLAGMGRETFMASHLGCSGLRSFGSGRSTVLRPEHLSVPTAAHEEANVNVDQINRCR